MQNQQNSKGISKKLQRRMQGIHFTRIAKLDEQREIDLSP